MSTGGRQVVKIGQKLINVVFKCPLTPLHELKSQHAIQDTIVGVFGLVTGPTLHLGLGRPQRLFQRAPAILLEGIYPQAILKLHNLSSLDYKACNRLLVSLNFLIYPQIQLQLQSPLQQLLALPTVVCD